MSSAQQNEANSDALYTQPITSDVGKDLSLNQRYRAAVGVFARIGAIANHTYFLITHLCKEGPLELDQSAFAVPVLADTTVEIPAKIYSAEIGAPMPTDLLDLDPEVWKPIHEDLEFITGEADEAGWEAGERQTVTVEVDGRRLEVVLPAGLGGLSAGGSGGAGSTKKAKRSTKKAGAAASGDAVTSPMQGTIVKVVVSEGQEVAEGDTVVVMEAMKMEQPLKAHKAGTVTGLQAEVGATVTNGAVICEIKD